MNILRSALAIALAASTLTANANEEQSSSPVFGLHFGIGFGGYTFAETSNNEEVEAGGGLLFGAFTQIPLAQGSAQPVFAKLGMSYMRDSVDAEDGDASFTKFPIDALVMTQVNSVKFGAGLTYHLNPTYKEDSPYVSGEVEFDNAVGLLIEADYSFANSNAEFGLRYTKIDYEIDGFEIDGNAFALTIGSTF